MGLESATFISQLVATNPVGATDPKAQGDDHLRMLKAVLQAQFPSLGAAAITLTAARINALIIASDNIAFTGANTYSAVQKYNASGGFPNAGVQIDSASPALSWRITGAAVDQKGWQFAFTSTTVFNLFGTNDAGGTNRSYLQFTRGAGVALTDISFGNATDNNTTQFLGSGLCTHNGNLRVDKSTPQLFINNQTPAVDNRLYKIFASGGSLSVTATNDADNTDRIALQITRSGNAVASLIFGNSTDNPQYNFAGSNYVVSRLAVSGSVAVPANPSTATSATIIGSQGSNPMLLQVDSAGAADTKIYRQYAVSGVLHFDFANDAYNSSLDWMTVQRTAISAASILLPATTTLQTAGQITMSAATPIINLNNAAIMSGTGVPNGVVSAQIGSIYLNKSGGAATTLWVKESGAGTNTGWVGK